MLAGLLGNAFGWDHRDTERLQALQDRLRFAARWDAEPEQITDYQTFDLGQSHMVDTSWTTRGHREDRKGGTAATGTHQRWRDYWANGVATVALTLNGHFFPAVEDLEHALQFPARPLFIGRKPCLPTSPVFVGRRKATGGKAALAKEPLADIGPRRRPDRIPALWPLVEAESTDTQERYDQRDWANNIHRGAERYAVGLLEITA